MNKYTSHITIDGKPLCHNHGYLIGTSIGSHDNRLACNHSDHRKARESYGYVSYWLVNANIRIKGGPCPIQGDGGKK